MPTKEQIIASQELQIAALTATLAGQAGVDITVATRKGIDRTKGSPTEGQLVEPKGRVCIKLNGTRCYFKPEDISPAVFSDAMVARVTEVIRIHKDFLNRKSEEQGRTWRFSD